jgi:MFS transporter, UMF1 family
MQTASKKVINGWAMFDWANSVYNLVITTTFFPAYYAVVTSLTNFPEGIRLFGRTYVNTELKDYVMAAGFLVIAFLSPIEFHALLLLFWRTQLFNALLLR